ncbi:MAG: flagellar motor protein MotB [Betaproteobacteria bacterium]|nr:flagellar motor protein MotB [Betaproteobacteria bacterium]
MDKSAKPTIVIRRVKKGGGHSHHGGAWKIAYADFVTAMMAFFLLMWLLGSTAKGDLHGIAEYFKTPLKVALAGGSGSGDSSSVIKGGGTDLTRTTGQVKRGNDKYDKRSINLQAARAEIARRDAERLEVLRRRLAAAIEQKDSLRAFREQIRVEITSEGLRIQIVDEQNRPMFDLGRAALKDYTRVILREIGVLLNDVESRISLAGHTDAAQYAMGEKGYSNWELSADRANASRRELVAAGMDEKKIVRVVGLASSVPFDSNNPLNPANRRISIVVLNTRAEEAISRGAGAVEVESAEEAGAALGVAVPDAEAAPASEVPGPDAVVDKVKD